MDHLGQEEPHILLNQDEKVILNQIAGLLVRENLMNPEEQLSFLALVKEET